MVQNLLEFLQDLQLLIPLAYQISLKFIIGALHLWWPLWLVIWLIALLLRLLDQLRNEASQLLQLIRHWSQVHVHMHAYWRLWLLLQNHWLPLRDVLAAHMLRGWLRRLVFELSMATVWLVQPYLLLFAKLDFILWPDLVVVLVLWCLRLRLSAPLRLLMVAEELLVQVIHIDLSQ